MTETFPIFSTRTRRTIIMGLALLALGPHAIAAGSSSKSVNGTGDAVASIEAFHATLAEVMQNADALGFEGRYQKLQPAIESKFDFPIIARVILGSHWDDLSGTQQQQFINLFTELTVATYAHRFNAYDGETFSYLQSEPLNKQRLLVQTQITQANGEPVRLDYLMHQRNGHWYIISVVAQGVNDLSLKRAEYTALVEEQGFDSLLTELQAKLDKLRSN